MELTIVPPERDWSAHFRRAVVTNCHYWLNRTGTDAKSMLAELPQVLKGLGFGLAVAEAWRPARDLLVQLSPWLLRRGPGTTWERYLTQGIDRAAAEGDPVEIELRLQLGHLYRLHGRLAEARLCCRQALTLCEQDQSHPHQLTLLNQLGLIARLAAQHDEALGYCRQVLAAP
ncbi:MAG: tetratricopeptide repeat protein, partial [Anaerolineae bacterium]|nr:tetratricopeptide repeat protein [Anaerolineae bacterium]